MVDDEDTGLGKKRVPFKEGGLKKIARKARTKPLH